MLVDIEVAYAEPQRQVVLELTLAEGAQVADALALALQDDRLEGLERGTLAVGVYGELCDHTRILQDGDRLEIYRELTMDAKTARRKRAAQQQPAR